MGRGRAKAKQQKVARELKYSTPYTDLSALERELHGAASRNGGSYARVDDEGEPEDEDEDGLEDLEDVDVDDDGDDPDDYGSWASGRR